MKAIPIKYVANVDLFFTNGTNWSIDVPALCRELRDSDAASKRLEEMITTASEPINLVEYVLDFDKIRSEISFISSRLGNDNNSNRNLY